MIALVAIGSLLFLGIIAWFSRNSDSGNGGDWPQAGPM